MQIQKENGGSVLNGAALGRREDGADGGNFYIPETRGTDIGKFTGGNAGYYQCDTGGDCDL